MNKNFVSRREGSILIEAAASLVVLSLTSAFIVGADIQNKKILKERILAEEVNRDIYNLINEIKFNVTFDEIEEEFKDGDVKLKCNESFSENLLDTEFKDLERGEDIIIIRLNEDEERTDFRIKADIKNENGEVIRNEEFFKSWWMDEI